MKTEGYLLDTNILIYLLEGQKAVYQFLLGLKQEVFFISTISNFEFLSGHSTEAQWQKRVQALEGFAPLDFRRETSIEASLFQQMNPHLRFKDLLIAATAKVEKLTLVTADKDFKKLKGLKVRLFKGPIQ